MDAGTWANVIAGLALLVSVTVAIRAESGRRSGARRTDAAEAAADRSAAAAERSASALEKTADQWAEFMSREEKRDQRQWSRFGQDPGELIRGSSGGPWMGLPPSAPQAGVVYWTVDKENGRRHQLTNIGQATAYAVELRCENAVRFDGPDVRDLQPGEAIEFLAIGSWQTGTPELIVSWSDEPDGERREWRRPLP